MFTPLQSHSHAHASAMTLDYVRYQQSRWLDYPAIKQIDLVGSVREVSIMKKWLSRHFPEIELVDIGQADSKTEFCLHGNRKLLGTDQLILDYETYQQSTKQDYAEISGIELVGNAREVNIMSRWLGKHFSDIAIQQPDFDEEQRQRGKIEQTGMAKLSPFNKFRYDEFWRIAKALSDAVRFHNLFAVDHANSISEFGELAIHPDNLQLMMFRVNRSKHMKSQPRYSWARQQQVIWSSIDTVGELMLSQQQIVEALIMQLAAVYTEQVDLELAR
ncbi:hypothetical protein [Motilimonas pumila]|uniref:Uncharacterized protein n=1 Tax=Motilimonas pumila TaxID=2303987 RepID=A0A418YAM3_9GAMM|nr:hypothetical protein [Motilimonas pumila]RJG40010.1 hypothetical protein D1Z90_17585 [Motilimonas pumila]